MQAFEIIDAADQEFASAMEGRRVSVRLRFLPAIERWSMDLALDGEPLLHGRLLSLGRDLLAPFDFNIGRLFVHAETKGAVPDYAALVGGTVTLYQADEADVVAALA